MVYPLFGGGVYICIKVSLLRDRDELERELLPEWRPGGG